MHIEFIIAMLVAIAVILLPVALVWFLNISGLWTLWKENRQRDNSIDRVRKKAHAE